MRPKQIAESINATFYEDCVKNDDNEIVPSINSEGFEGEYVQDEDEAPEQDQSNQETTFNQEEIRNNQRDVQENSLKALK